MAFSMNESYGTSGGYQLLSEGWHTVYITKAKLGYTKKQDDMISMRYTVIGESSEAENTVLDWIVLVPKPWGYGKLQQLCKSIDPSISGAEESDTDGFNPHDRESLRHYLLGKPLAIKVKHVDNSYINKMGEEKTGKKASIENWRMLEDSEKDSLQSLYGEGEGYIVPPLPSDAEEDLASFPG